MFVGTDGRRILWASSTSCAPDDDSVKVIATDLDVGAGDLLRSYMVRDGKVILKADAIPFSDLKVAMITPYGINCGIATYSKYLCDAMRPMVRELRIFAEKADGADDNASDNIVRCWDRAGNYTDMLAAIAGYDPDVSTSSTSTVVLTMARSGTL